MHHVALCLSLSALQVSAPESAPHHLFQFEGSSGGDRFGAAVAALGDLDGDGHDDLAFGAPREGAAGLSAGLVRVVSGRTGAVLYELAGDDPFDAFGTALAAVGDVDGDGRIDLGVGAPAGDPPAGAVTVHSGLDGTLLRSWSGAAPGDRFGAALAGAGDVNGDGYADVLVGSPQADGGGLNAGRVELVSGKDGSRLWVRTGVAGDLLGSAVSGTGTSDRVLVGVPFADGSAFNAGRVLVLRGSDGVELDRVEGEAAGDRFGSTVGRAEDQDGDGVEDWLAGAPGADERGLDSGTVGVYSGATGARLWSASGLAPGTFLQLGAPAGDVDADGTPDLALGSPGATGSGTDSGLVRVVSGATGDELWSAPGDAAQDWLGASLARAGDVNADGIVDLVAGAPVHDDVTDTPGYARVLSTRPLSLTADEHALSVEAGGRQTLRLFAPEELGLQLHFVLGSLAGTAPGLVVGSGLLPLAFEPLYLPHTLHQPNAAPLFGGLGVLDEAGFATAAFRLPPASPAFLAGLEVHHAYLVLTTRGEVVFASNPVPLLLLP